MGCAYWNPTMERFLTRDTSRSHTRSVDRYSWTRNVDKAYVGFLSGYKMRHYGVEAVPVHVIETRTVTIL